MSLLTEAQSAYILSRLVFTLSALIFTFCLSSILKYLVDGVFFRVKSRIASDYIAAKTRTLRTLLKNIIDIVLFVMVLLVILSQWGVNITPILTGAGIFGLAFSFGSQTLVKDLIAGFFIIVEDQYNIGDKIKLDKAEGTVSAITLRLTVLKDKDGNMVYIPNSEIKNVMKYKRQPAKK